MRRLLYALAIVSVAVLSFHCQREVSFNPIDNNNNSAAPVTATVQGNIIDENGQPASGVLIRVGNKSATTDNKGYFRIVKAALDKKASLVTAEKTGYFKSYRTFTATTGANHVEIKLIKRSLTGNIPASGGEVTLSNGAKISLPANSVVKAAGGSYSGAINVYAAFIDPTAADIRQTVPGSFLANDANNNRVVLTSYGMLAVELESSSGEKLQIATGNKAKISLPIPASIQGSAPASIPLWYVDEQTGIWKEEGTATKNGNIYEGEVSHFSFWNYDVTNQTIMLSMKLVDPHGVPLVHVPVRLTRSAAGAFQAYGFTDSLGQVSGWVPANETLNMAVLDPCNNAVFSQNIGPFTQNTNLGTIVITNTTSGLLTIKGKILNCSAAIVTNGSAIITYGNNSSYINVNSSGEFSITFTRCSASPTTFDVVGIDHTNQQQGTMLGATVVTPVTDIGTLAACGTSTQQFINYTVDGTNYVINTSPPDTLAGYIFNQGAAPYPVSIRGHHHPNHINFEFNASTMAAGTYLVNSLVVNNQWCIPVNPLNVTITNFPQTTGGFFEGSLSGQFTDSVGTNTHNISATFKVRRQ